MKGPADLLRSLPAALGRRPRTGETILIGWNDEAPDRAVTVAIHPDAYPWEQTQAAHQLAADGATRCTVVAYTGPDPGPELGLTLNWLVASAVRYGVDPLDALIVTRRRDGSSWRSLDCTNPSCCPPEGTPLTEETPAP